MKKMLLIWVILTASLLAQPGPPGEGPRGDMDAIRIWKLTESLELTEEQITTFIPAMQLHERKMRELQREMMKEMREIHAKASKEDLSQKDVDAVLKRYLEMQAEMDKTKSTFISDLPKYLTPRQQLIYLSFEAEFRKQLRTFLKEHRGAPGRMHRQ